MTKKPTWRDLLNFIEQQVQKEGDVFLDNLLFIEMQNPEYVNKSFEVIKDSEGWEYCAPAWRVADKIEVLTTSFPNKKIRTLNINY